jgi:hypothetical protein
MKVRFFVHSVSGAALPGVLVRLALRIAASPPTRDDIEVAARDYRLADLSTHHDTDADPYIAIARAGRTALAAGANEEGMVVLATTRSDRHGYGRLAVALGSDPAGEIQKGALLLALLSRGARLVVEAVGDPDSVIDLINNTVLAGFRKGSINQLPTLPAGTETLLLDALRDLLEGPNAAAHLTVSDSVPSATAGHVEDPDCTDYALSPESFVSRRDIKIGDDGCEYLAPATLPLRQYPLYQVVVHGRDPAATDEVPSLPSITDTPPLDTRILWGQIYEFSQSWTSLGHSLGEVKYSLALAPGEAVKLAVIDWRRQDDASRAGVNQSRENLAHEQAVERDIEDIVSGRVAEEQSGESFIAGLAGAMDFTIPQYGISAAGRHSVGFGMSSSRGKRDMAAEAQQSIQLRTQQNSSLVRGQSSSVVLVATQAESNAISTRIVANMNRGHALSILYYEVLRHLCVHTEFRRADPVILIPVQTFGFDGDTALRFRDQLEPSLRDTAVRSGFDALEWLAFARGTRANAAPAAGGGSAPPAPPPPPSPTVTTFEVGFTTEWRWSVILNKYVPPADTAGEVQVVLGLEDGSELTIVNLTDRPPVFEQFSDINNFPASWPGWRIETEAWDSNTNSFGRRIAYFTLGGQSVDVRTIKSATLRWKRVRSNLVPFSPENDGWNLTRLSVRATMADGKQHQLVDHRYVLASAQKELFERTSNGNFQSNTAAPLLSVVLSTPTPAPGSPAGGNTGATTGSIGEEAEKAFAAQRLIAHLNSNRYFYSAAVWLNMDPRERRLRLAPFVGGLLNGVSDQPLAMTGNHLAYRYAGDLPSDARESLPDTIAALKPQDMIVTLPTRGIFAEAHLGNCNAAEKRDITRFWNFDELPVSLLPNIDTLTAGPRGTQPTITPDQLAAANLGIQAIPGLPAPGEAVAKAMELLAKPDIFRDMSARQEVAEVMGKLIESAQPPKLSGAGVGSAFGGGAGAEAGASAGRSPSAPPLVEATSDPSDWANPFPDRSLDTSNGSSFLAERYKNVRLTDDSDRIQLLPELAAALKGSGASQQTVDDAIGKHVKGPTSVIRKTPAGPGPSNIAVQVKTKIDVEDGVTRALDGFFTLTFSPPGDQLESPLTGITVGVRQGAIVKRLALPSDSYTVRADYKAAKPENLGVLRDPTADALGLNGAALVALAMDLLQKDLAGEDSLPQDIKADNVAITAQTAIVEVEIVAKLAKQTNLAFEYEATLGTEFNLDLAGRVKFDTAGLKDIAKEIAAMLKIKQAGAVAALLSVFTIESNIGVDNKLKTAGGGKATLKFVPYILQDLSLTATPKP